MIPVREYNPADYEHCTPVEFNYPESIPKDFRGQPVVWRKSIHVGGLFKPHYAWNVDLIPAKFRERLCYGPIPTNVDEHKSYERVRGMVVCGDCELPKVYTSHWCISCGEFFIRDFADTRFCTAYPHCWNCLPKLSWSYCTDHASPNHVQFVADSGYTTMISPQGFNPKDYDDDDLEDFISNELGI